MFKGSNPSSPTKTASNKAEDKLLDVNERILKEISEAYVNKVTASSSIAGSEPKRRLADLKPGEEGLLAICHKLGLPCIAPRRKINIMIVGNHSAGKSSFINWYIGEHVQTTAVAIETQGFTFCTSGKRRETLKGQATMKYFTHLQTDLEPYAPQIYNGLQTEISTSIEKDFKLITFIDTPGLVDGSFQYPFAVEDAILSVAQHVDLIYIFFDPIGQALCDRNMRVVERLNEDHADKLRYFLSKADTVPDEQDRCKVLVQITQNLASRVPKAHALQLPTLYIPSFSDGKSKVANCLEETCEQMKMTIKQSVQNNLNKLERDCKLVNGTIDAFLADDRSARQHNRTVCMRGFFLGCLSFVVFVVFLSYFLHATGLMKLYLAGAVPDHIIDTFGQTCDAIVIDPNRQPAVSVFVADSSEPAASDAAAATAAPGLLTLPQFMLCMLVAFALPLVFPFLVWKYRPSLTSKERANLDATKKHVMGEVLEVKVRLYKLYLDGCASDVQ